MRRAVTLVELLVVIIVISMLALLLVTMIRGVRSTARNMQDLSNLRQTMVDFHAYAGAHDDIVVNVGLPAQEEALWFYTTMNWSEAIYVYESQQTSWSSVLARWIGHGSRHWHSTYDDMTYGGVVNPSSLPPGFDLYRYPSKYLYSRTMLTKPTAWLEEGLPEMAYEDYAKEYFQVVRFSDVTSPAAKGVLIHLELPDDDRIHVAFADGSASLKRLSEGVRPTARPPTASPGAAPGRPVLSTLHGYQGRDF